MSVQYNDIFLEKYNKLFEDKILLNCKKFLSLRIPEIYFKKQEEKNNQNKPKLFKLTNLHISNNNSINEIDNIKTKRESKIIPEIKSKSAIMFYNINKENKKIHKSEFNKYELNEKVYLRKNHSAKNFINNKNNNKYTTQSKVREIIKNLLSGNKFNNKPKTERTREKLKNFIPPNKYVEFYMRKEPSNIKLFKSYKTQIKYFFNKKNRKILIEGINDYHQNIKLYNGIYFNSVVGKDIKNLKKIK